MARPASHPLHPHHHHQSQYFSSSLGSSSSSSSSSSMAPSSSTHLPGPSGRSRHASAPAAPPPPKLQLRWHRGLVRWVAVLIAGVCAVAIVWGRRNAWISAMTGNAGGNSQFYSTYGGGYDRYGGMNTEGRYMVPQQQQHQQPPPPAYPGASFQQMGGAGAPGGFSVQSQRSQPPAYTPPSYSGDDLERIATDPYVRSSHYVKQSDMQAAAEHQRMLALQKQQEEERQLQEQQQQQQLLAQQEAELLAQQAAAAAAAAATEAPTVTAAPPPTPPPTSEPTATAAPPTTSDTPAPAATVAAEPEDEYDDEQLIPPSGGGQRECHEDEVWVENCRSCMPRPGSAKALKAPEKLHFIHVPKSAGTAFTVPLRRALDCGPPGRGCWGDPASVVEGNVNCDGQLVGCYGHTGFTPDPSRWTMSLLRHPLGRLRSAFHHGRHMDGAEDADKIAAQSTTTVEQYARYPGVRGCQTKMLLGQRCAARKRLTTEDVNKARANIDQLFFLGLTEHYNTSICMFFLQMGQIPIDSDFASVRTNPAYDRTARLPVEAERSILETDSIDHILYTHARKEFRRRVEAAGLTVLEPESTYWRDYGSTGEALLERVSSGQAMATSAE
ncbi:hypothetical protein H696_05016 [Fonticula alba]|uniref:Sulfotransferase domain-containing protein n=1 Tax=Fonticula alba TaxID=691883 RepID=A0A058Z387_FONAL|nr:hypothetical protein H696_05016 [Fonticula alba]KCV68730.1 hypothetical protein H696_05016 [Fonticula alba]|eukprot:XP_009497162.1 hypothetical protein H696_05016 [Fonticula alba]